MIDADLAQIEFVMKVNYFGVWNGVSAFGERFVARGTQAGIYNVGSENSFYKFVRGMFAYESAKHGLHALSDALREEVPDFIDVSLVCPGFVSSEMTAPVGGEFAMDTDRYTNIAMKATTNLTRAL